MVPVPGTLQELVLEWEYIPFPVPDRVGRLGMVLVSGIPDTPGRVLEQDMGQVPGTPGIPDTPGRLPAQDMEQVPDTQGRLPAQDMGQVPDTQGIPEQAVPPFPVISEVLPEPEPQGLVLCLDISRLQQRDNNEIQSRWQHLRQMLLRRHYRLHARL